MVKKVSIEDSIVKEVTKDLKTIYKTHEAQSDKPSDIKLTGSVVPEYRGNTRVAGLKIALWAGFFWIGYKAYSLTPLKDELNRIFDEDFF